MTINYIGVLKADICLDNGMIVYHGMNNSYHTLQEYIDKATYFINKCDFVNAQIVDCETDDIVVEIEGDYNNSCDDDSVCYDNGNTSNYE